MSDRKILYLINPISGTSKKDGIKKLIERETAAQEIPFEIVATNAQGDYDFLKEKVAKEDFTDIVIIGGDGTVNQVTDAFREIDIRFGIIPVGSGNGLARSACIPMKPQQSLALVFAGTARHVDAFLINNQYSCMLSGIGFDAQVAHDFANASSRGLMMYTQQSLVNYFKAHPYQFEIILDNFSFFSDAFFISIANSNQFGNNFTIAPKAEINDGLLDIVVVQKMNKAKLPFAILKQVRGNNKLNQLVEDMTKKNVIYFQTDSLTVKNLKHAPLHIDGEPRDTADEFNIKVLKDCFRLIQP
ncbi:YegS/Rv2252/BmrU family lipid kinase [Sediminibacterium roseum]|uniref:YegS/Rv2252/BmrU family lipid kinase n=1 Tax=Sediminibacterium roseum TaxID=1978412 RepID=A0ABW9ZX73_9BACT|nr:YegS/Rv2252/BmrU family lipid kinase [Sediminibacterium roseum]NCI51767.1 YegS/Rv2252/BmrU family lipid kinase [Sediminibacterium roseum]